MANRAILDNLNSTLFPARDATIENKSTKRRSSAWNDLLDCGGRENPRLSNRGTSHAIYLLFFFETDICKNVI